jgi:hypothetical protein
MPVGHVALDGREYMLADTRQYRQMLGNQMALPGTQGTNEFRSLDSWDALLLSDFTQGLGVRDVASGGYRYAEADARYPGSLLPLALPYSPHVFHVDQAVDEFLRATDSGGLISLEVGVGRTYTKIRLRPTNAAASAYSLCMLYAALSDGVVKLKVSLYNAVTLTLTQLSHDVVQAGTPETMSLPRWLALGAVAGSVPANEHYIEIEPTQGSVRLPLFVVQTTGDAPHKPRLFDGAWATWANDQWPLWYMVMGTSPTKLLGGFAAHKMTSHIEHLAQARSTNFATNPDLINVRTTSVLGYGVTAGIRNLQNYLAAPPSLKSFNILFGENVAYKFDRVTRLYRRVVSNLPDFAWTGFPNTKPAYPRPADHTVSQSIVRESYEYSPGQYDDVIYICNRASYEVTDLTHDAYMPNSIVMMPVDEEVGYSLNVHADYIAYASGYYFRCLQNKFCYSTVFYRTNIALGSRGAGESEWFTVGAAYPIEAIATLGENTYVITAEALWWFAPGDIVTGLVQWPVRAVGTVRAVTWQESLYVSMSNKLFRYTTDGRLIDVSPGLKPGMKGELRADITALSSTDHMLLVGMASYVVGWDGLGWGMVAHLPGHQVRSIVVDRGDGMLVILTDKTVFHLQTPLTGENPVQATPAPLFSSEAWLETDWFWGGTREVLKDWESVTISLDDELIQPSDSVSVYVWFEGANAADRTGWTLLGTTALGESVGQIRFTGANRQPSHRIKIGLWVKTRSSQPVAVENVRLKYQIMLNDTWRWSFPILISGDTEQPQQMLDGAPNPYTRTQQIAHLRALAKAAAPVAFRDLTGQNYEVKVEEAGFFPSRVEVVGGTTESDGIVQVTVEEQGGAVSA